MGFGWHVPRQGVRIVGYAYANITKGRPYDRTGLLDCNEGYVISSELYRPGDDLLSRDLRRSTIGPGRLNDRVRNGIGWGPSGIATRSIKLRVSRRHNLTHMQSPSLRSVYFAYANKVKPTQKTSFLLRFGFALSVLR